METDAPRRKPYSTTNAFEWGPNDGLSTSAIEATELIKIIKKQKEAASAQIPNDGKIVPDE